MKVSQISYGVYLPSIGLILLHKLTLGVHSEEAQKMLVARREMTTDRLEWLLSLEDGEPFTLNNELLRMFQFSIKRK